MASEPRPRKLSTNVLANLVTVGATVPGGIISVPLIVGHLGLTGYGIWTVALTGLAYVTTVEAGVGPAIQRFTAVAGTSDDRIVLRMLWSTLTVYTVFGAILAAAAIPLAPLIVDVFHVHRTLRPDATSMFRIAGVAALLTLVAAALGNIQQGLEQYVEYSVSGACAAIVYLVGIIVAVLTGAGLSGLAWAAVAQQAVMLLLRAWALRGMLSRAPRFATRDDARTVGAFALRVQVSMGSMLVNQQTDKVVVGVIAPGTVLGQLGIGTQLAEAGRVVGTAALSPIVNRLAAVHAGPGPDNQLERLFRGLHELWGLVVIGGTVLGAASLYPLIGAWMGPGHHKAAELGVFLVLGYGFNLLTGTPIAYLRAVGRPNLEAQLGLLSIVVNVVLTVALGIAFGAVGVVVATMCGLAGATVWFFSRLPAYQVPAVPLVRIRALCAALVCGALSLAWGALMVHLLGRWGALGPVLIGLGICFILFIGLATGGVPTRARLNAILNPAAG